MPLSPDQWLSTGVTAGVTAGAIKLLDGILSRRSRKPVDTAQVEQLQAQRGELQTNVLLGMLERLDDRMREQERAAAEARRERDLALDWADELVRMIRDHGGVPPASPL